MNDEAVRTALHAAPQDLTGPWQLCSRRIKYKSDGGSMLPIHNALVRQHGEHHAAAAAAAAATATRALLFAAGRHAVLPKEE